MEKLILFGGIGSDGSSSGLTLEEAYATRQIVFGPTICIISSTQPIQPTSNIFRKTLLEPEQLINILKMAFPIRLNSGDIQGQNNRWGNLSRSYATLVSDGNFGHCIDLVGINRKSGDFIFFDPFPGRSLLCEENNSAGVSAVQSPGERFWLISEDDFKKVVYAVFMPYSEWSVITNKNEAMDIIAKSKKREKFHTETKDEKRRLEEFIAICDKENLLTVKGKEDLLELYNSDKLFDTSSEGFDILYYLIKLVTETRKEVVDLKEILNGSVEILNLIQKTHPNTNLITISKKFSEIFS